jgi:pimeloyl-ACP methyl ester carboxylesterase
MPDPLNTRFAKVGDVHIAYQVVGEGPIDILFIDTWVHHVEQVWDFPEFARLLRRLASFGRLIHFDRRGTGLSDPVPLDALPDFDTQVEDVIAVLDAAGSERPAIVGSNDGTLVAMLLAAAHPERCDSLVLFTPTAKHAFGEGQSTQSIDDVVTLISTSVDDSGLDWLAPSRVGDADFDRRLLKLQRNSVRQGAMGHYYRQTLTSDIGDTIPKITCPTLVMNRTGNRIVPIEHSRDVAAGIDGAKLVELPGEDHLIFSQGIDRIATGCSPHSCSPTSWIPRTGPPSGVIGAGGICSISITRWCAPSSSASAVARSPRPGTASSRRSPHRRRRCGAPWR